MAEIKNSFSVGDYIIDFENIYKIVDQKNQKDLSYFYYEPINESNNRTTYSTPINNIFKSGLRPLISSDVVKKLYKEAGEKIDHDTVVDYKSIKETLYENDPEKSLIILKQLFLEREKTSEKFSRTNKDFLEVILKHISDEIAFVTEKPTEKVSEKLTSFIQKAIK